MVRSVRDDDESFDEETTGVRPVDTVMKTCGCGASYTWKRWNALHYVGLMDCRICVLELRQCTCGSTIGLRVMQA